ncbi:MAG: hypothetical protein NZ872_06150 [Archaeoglobaceae archaeon]|nr:hypothetical protein [Archaeoglobaceae archaeon]MDW8128782.1 hypothetical protein [Archaeoglobaceae archaeon]
MRARRLGIVLLYLTLIAVGIGATIYFNIKGSVEVFEGNITVSPQSFSVDLAKGVEYVKQITVRNHGANVCVYFEDVVEGPTPKEIDVSYKDAQGNSIYSTKKLCLPEGSQSNPSNATVNVHVKVKDTAEVGKYSIYIFVRR